MLNSRLTLISLTAETAKNAEKETKVKKEKISKEMLCVLGALGGEKYGLIKKPCISVLIRVLKIRVNPPSINLRRTSLCQKTKTLPYPSTLRQRSVQALLRTGMAELNNINFCASSCLFAVMFFREICEICG